MSDFCDMFPSECEPVDCEADPLGDGCDIIDEDPDWDKVNTEQAAADKDYYESTAADDIVERGEYEDDNKNESYTPYYDQMALYIRYKGYNDADPFLGNSVYTFIAGAAIVYNALELFRYRSASTYYDIGKISGGTNWWEIASLIHYYSGLVSFSFIFVT